MVHAEKETNREKKTIYIKTINKYMKKNLKRKKKALPGMSQGSHLLRSTAAKRMDSLV